jgi:hypothetical protein
MNRRKAMKRFILKQLVLVMILMQENCAANAPSPKSESEKPLSDEQINYIKTDGEKFRGTKDKHNYNPELTKDLQKESKQKLLNYQRCYICLKQMKERDSTITSQLFYKYHPNELEISFDKEILGEGVADIQIDITFYENYEQARSFTSAHLFNSAITPTKLPEKGDNIGDYHWEYPMGQKEYGYTTIVLYSNTYIKYSFNLSPVPNQISPPPEYCQKKGKEYLLNFLKYLNECQEGLKIK